MSDMLNKLREARAEAVAAAEELLAAEPTAEVLDAAEARTAEIKDLDSKIEAVEELAQRTAAVAESRAAAGVDVFSPRVTVGAEPSTYRQNGDHSYFRDLFRATTFGDRDSLERLHRNDAEVRTSNGLNTTDNTGGEMVPPLWLMDVIPYARAQRVVASEVNNLPLPPGTDSISLPRLSGGTAVAEVSTQNSALQETDATTDSVTAAVTTIAGVQRLSLQLLEQAPVNVDQIIMQDLMSALSQKIDQFVISNNATGKYGITAVSSINTATYTSTSPTASGLYAKIADGIQQIHSGRFAAPTKIFMHPRRWAFFLAAADSQNRPLVVPNAGGPVNVMGNQDGVVSAGAAGSLQGLPVFLDANITTTAGSGTNEDKVIIVKHDDLWLWESSPKAEVFRETYAEQGSVLVRLYEFLAFQGGRFPESIAVVSGSGLSTPSF